MTRVVVLHDVEGLDRTEFSRYKYGLRPAVDRFAAVLAQRAEAALADRCRSAR
jgi:hypothetical protein